MSRIRTYIVGRDRECDVRLDDSSVSRRHAECVRLADGRLYITDCATTNGTFVLEGEEWREVRQTFVEPSSHIRFGDYRMTAKRLNALCSRADAGASLGEADSGESSDSAGPGDDALDPSRGLVFDPQTGEVLEKEPQPLRRKRSER